MIVRSLSLHLLVLLLLAMGLLARLSESSDILLALAEHPAPTKQPNPEAPSLRASADDSSTETTHAGGH